MVSYVHIKYNHFSLYALLYPLINNNVAVMVTINKAILQKPFTPNKVKVVFGTPD